MRTTGLDRQAHRRWFLPTVAVFPIGDFALPGLPNQLLLIALATLHPRRWWKLVLTFAAATGLGALLLTIGVQSAGTWLLEAIAVDSTDNAALREVTHGIERYGLWILIGLSLLPSTPRTAVLACALAGLPPWAVAVAVTTARLVPTTALALLGAKTPHLLRRLRSVDRVLTEVESRRASAD